MPHNGSVGSAVLQIILDHMMSGMCKVVRVDEASGELVWVFQADGHVMNHSSYWWRSNLGRPTRDRIRVVLLISSISSIWRGDNFVVTWAKWNRLEERNLEGESWAHDIDIQLADEQAAALYRHYIEALPLWLASMTRSTVHQAEWLLKGPVGAALDIILGYCPIGEGGAARAEENADWALARLYNYRSLSTVDRFGVHMPRLQRPIHVTNAQLKCAERILRGISDSVTMREFAVFIYRIKYGNSISLIKGSFWTI